MERSTRDVYASRPCPRLAASRATRRLASPASAPAWAGDDALGQRGRGNSERGQLLDQAFDALRVGLFVHPVERRDVASFQKLGHPLVGQDHQMLDQPVGLGLGTEWARTTAPSPSNSNSGSKDSISSAPTERLLASAAAARRAWESGSATAAGGELRPAKNSSSWS